jgi:hypothetical protein
MTVIFCIDGSGWVESPPWWRHVSDRASSKSTSTVIISGIAQHFSIFLCFNTAPAIIFDP